MLKIEDSIMKVLHPRIKNELKRLSSAEDRLSLKVNNLEDQLKDAHFDANRYKDEVSELMEDFNSLENTNYELRQDAECNLAEISRLRAINCDLTEKYAMKSKSRAETSAPSGRKFKFNIAGRFVYTSSKVLEEDVVINDSESRSIREVLERWFTAEDKVFELQSKLEKQTTQKESIWDIEELWYEYQLQNRSKMLKIRYCENDMGRFIDSRIFENGHPTKKGLCISVNDFDEFSRYIQRTNSQVQSIKKELKRWGY